MLAFNDADHEVESRFTLADQGDRFTLELRRGAAALPVVVAGGAGARYIVHTCRNAQGVVREQLLFFGARDDAVAGEAWKALCSNPRQSLRGLGWSGLVVDRRVGYSAMGGMSFF